MSCSYGPDARVLKNIRLKKLLYSDAIKSQLINHQLDSTALNYVLRKGDINFSDSDTRHKPCGIYIVEGDYKDQEIILTVENCDSVATITNFRIEN